MIRRRIALGPKHYTPAYFVNGILLDCIDMTAYILTHGYDNQYGHEIRHDGNLYPRNLEKKYFLTTINSGRSLSQHFSQEEFDGALLNILREFYPKRLDEFMKQRNARIVWDLPRNYSLRWAELKVAANQANSPLSDEELRSYTR